MPTDENGDKWACENCIRGHRSTKCSHWDRWMFRVKRPGRPLTSCPHNGDKTCHCYDVKYMMIKIQKGDDCFCAPDPAKHPTLTDAPVVKGEDQSGALPDKKPNTVDDKVTDIKGAAASHQGFGSCCSKTGPSLPTREPPSTLPSRGVDHHRGFSSGVTHRASKSLPTSQPMSRTTSLDSAKIRRPILKRRRSSESPEPNTIHTLRPRLMSSNGMTPIGTGVAMMPVHAINSFAQGPGPSTVQFLHHVSYGTPLHNGHGIQPQATGNGFGIDHFSIEHPDGVPSQAVTNSFATSHYSSTYFNGQQPQIFTPQPQIGGHTMVTSFSQPGPYIALTQAHGLGNPFNTHFPGHSSQFSNQAPHFNGQTFTTSSALAHNSSSDLSEICGCGPSCNCLRCTVHPFNQANIEDMDEIFNMLNEQQNAVTSPTSGEMSEMFPFDQSYPRAETNTRPGTSDGTLFDQAMPHYEQEIAIGFSVPCNCLPGACNCRT